MHINVTSAVSSSLDAFLKQDRRNPEVEQRLSSIRKRYQELLDLAELRRQRLQDALALYKLFNDADGVEQWIAEKVVLLHCCVFGLTEQNLLFRTGAIVTSTLNMTCAMMFPFSQFIPIFFDCHLIYCVFVLLLKQNLFDYFCRNFEPDSLHFQKSEIFGYK